MFLLNSLRSLSITLTKINCRFIDCIDICSKELLQHSHMHLNHFVYFWMIFKLNPNGICSEFQVISRSNNTLSNIPFHKAPGWYLEKVLIKDTESDAEYSFPCRRYEE